MMLSIRTLTLIVVLVTASSVTAQDPDAVEALKRGLEAEQAGKLDEALREYRQATALDPSNALARGALATALAKSGELDAALREARRAVALEPKEFRMRVLLGEVLRKSGEYGQSLDSYQRAYDLNSDTSLTQFGLVEAFLKVGQNDKAVNLLREILKRDDGSVLARLMLGELLLSNRKGAEAAKQFERVRQLNPDDEKIGERIDKRLEKCAEVQKLEEALPAILKGEAEPKDADEKITLAEICSRNLDKNLEAAKFYQEALKQDPKLLDPPAPHQYNLACVYLLVADGKGEGADTLTDEARTQYRTEARELLHDARQRWAKMDPDPKNESRDPLDALRYWRFDPDLAPIREPDQLAKLPESERTQWQTFWAEHDEIIEKLTSKKP